MPSTPFASWDEATAEKMHRDLVMGGWSRLRPSAAYLLLVGTVINMGPLTTQHAIDRLAGGNWDATCWDPVDHFTEDELAELKAEYGDDADCRSAAEVNAEADAQHREWVANATRYAAHYGLGPVETCGDVLGLLLATGVLCRENDLLYPVNPIPRVEDVFPVSEKERAALVDLRAAEAAMRAEAADS